MKQPPNPFLTAEWKNLVMVNYEADPALLLPYLPSFTEIDLYENKCYVSLVGFAFENIRLMGLSIPWHRNFPEVNLRFYVKRFDGKNWRRGVVFISEIVPLRAIGLVANNLYRENYRTMKMVLIKEEREEVMGLQYKWQFRRNWNVIAAEVGTTPVSLQSVPGADFITNHYWGYSTYSPQKTYEYKVEHPEWDILPLQSYHVDCDFENLYGKQFAFLRNEKPASVFVAKGSAIKIYNKAILK